MLGKGKTKEIKTMSFETIIKQGGNSGRIIIPKSLIGKKVKVTIQVLCLAILITMVTSTSNILMVYAQQQNETSLEDAAERGLKANRELISITKQITNIIETCTDIARTTPIDITLFELCAQFKENNVDSDRSFLLENRNITDIILFGLSR